MDLNRNKDHPAHRYQGREFAPVHELPGPEKNPLHQGRAHPVHLHSETSPEPEITIYIDNTPYSIPDTRLTGADIRALAKPPISADKDLFHVIAGQGSDVKIGDADVVEIHPHEATHGRHFYSINKTSCRASRMLAEKIAQEAYSLYLQQGCKHGHDVEHWLQAEARLTQSSKKGSFN